MALPLAVLLILAAAPPRADTLGPEAGLGLRPRIVPSAFWSPTRGLGVGGGVALQNVAGAGSELEAIAEVMQRYQRLRAAFFTDDPREAGRYGGLRLGYTTTSVRAFYGLGPRASRSHKIVADYRRLEAELHLGWRPAGARGLLLQPTVRLLHERLPAFRDDRPGAFEHLDPASRASLLRAAAGPTTGLTYGLELALDGREWPGYGARGTLLQLTGRRYDGLGRDPFRYWSATASLFHVLPLSGRHALAGRAVLALTRSAGAEALPFYALPVLDDAFLGAFSRYRFAGRDLLVLSAEYRFPLLGVLDWLVLDGAVQFHLANAYEDVFRQLAPGVSFAREPGGEGARTPLRPALALGGRIVNLDGGRILLGGVAGIAAEGLTFGSIHFAYGLGEARPLVR